MNLRTATIRLAYENPDLRPYLLPILEGMQKQGDTELPRPSDVSPSEWEDHATTFQGAISTLERAGFKVVRFTPNDRLSYVDLKKGKDQFSLDLEDLWRIKGVRSLVKNWSKVEEVIRHFDTISNPFYSNLDSVLKRVVKNSVPANLAHKVVVGAVKNSGKRWT